MIQVNVTHKGPIFNEFGGNILINKAKAIADDIAVVVIKKARERYMEVKVTEPKIPSAIFDSFDSTPPLVNKNEVRKVVFAGSPVAPHITFVIYDRPLRNGVMWSMVNPNAPYNFMKVGRDEGEKAATAITKKYFK